MRRQSICVLMMLMLPGLAFAGEQVVSEAHGIPTFIKGELGFVDPLPTKTAGAQDEELFRLSARVFLQDLAVASLGATGNEELRIERVLTYVVKPNYISFLASLRLG